VLTSGRRRPGSGIGAISAANRSQARFAVGRAGRKALTRRFGPAAPLYLAGALAGAAVPVLGLVLFAAPAIFFWRPLGHRDVATGERGESREYGEPGHL
jgi:hypothetical protein